MTTIDITTTDLPDLAGKTVVITGGASGIGLASAHIFAAKGAIVHCIDRDDPHPEDGQTPENMHFHQIDVTDWNSMLAFFESIPRLDIAVSNAGVSQECDYFADTFSEKTGKLEEPQYKVLDVNLRAVVNFVKLSLYKFKQNNSDEKQNGHTNGKNHDGLPDRAGSIVLISSATGYSPEHSLPVYSASKLGVVGLVRSLRASLPISHNVTINSVAPAATETRLLPPKLAAPIKAAGAPVSSAEHVGRAVVFSATATQDHQVELYGRDTHEMVMKTGPWNGRTLITLGDSYTEVEEPIASLRTEWFGEYNTERTAFQQILTDMRGLPIPGA